MADAGGSSEVAGWWDRGEDFAAAMLCLSSPKLGAGEMPLPWRYPLDLTYCRGELNQTYFYIFTVVGFTQTFCTMAVCFFY